MKNLFLVIVIILFTVTTKAQTTEPLTTVKVNLGMVKTYKDSINLSFIDLNNTGVNKPYFVYNIDSRAKQAFYKMITLKMQDTNKTKNPFIIYYNLKNEVLNIAISDKFNVGKIYFFTDNGQKSNYYTLEQIKTLLSI